MYKYKKMGLNSQLQLTYQILTNCNILHIKAWDQRLRESDCDLPFITIVQSKLDKYHNPACLPIIIRYYNPAHLCTAVAWREKILQAFCLLQIFSLILALLKSRILNKLDFKLFHYEARVQPVSKITTIATRNRCKTNCVQLVFHDYFKN